MLVSYQHFSCFFHLPFYLNIFTIVWKNIRKSIFVAVQDSCTYAGTMREPNKRAYLLELQISREFIWTNQRTRFIIARNTRQVNTSAELTPVLLEHTSCKTDINRQITRPAVAYGHRNTAEHRRSMCACFLYSETWYNIERSECYILAQKSCPPFSTYGLGVRYICSLVPVDPGGGRTPPPLSSTEYR